MINITAIIASAYTYMSIGEACAPGPTVPLLASPELGAGGIFWALTRRNPKIRKKAETSLFIILIFIILRFWY